MEVDAGDAATTESASVIAADLIARVNGRSYHRAVRGATVGAKLTQRLTMENVERPLPLLDEESRPFWEAGRDGVLSFVSCRDCGELLHPPAPVCRYCRSTDLGH